MTTNSEFLFSGGGGAPAAYQIQRSVRFNSADSAYLSRTPSVAGNRKTWTWSGWVKRSSLVTDSFLLVAESEFVDRLQFALKSDGTIIGYGYSSGSVYLTGSTTAVFRDFSAWYHVTLTWDTTQVTGSDRFKLYVNGIQQQFNFTITPAQNRDGNVNLNQSHFINAYPRAGQYANMYLADVHFIDGQALDPTSFGEFDTYGVWQPKAYTGTYGTNGFHLPFSDNSTAAALGTDTSGNSNTWTVNNLSVAAGAGNDSLVDTPTNYGTDTGVGGEVRGNYATLNPLAKDGGTTLSNGNLDLSSTNYGNNTATFFLTSGKWYWEGSGEGYVAAICGKVGQNWDASISVTGSNSIGWWFGGAVYWGGGNNGGATIYSSSDIVGTALDMDSGVVYFYKNGTLTYTITFGSGTVPDLSDGVFPCYNNGLPSGTKTATFNFGQRPFAYAAPTGYKALCTQNLPDPTIAQPSESFQTVLWTGDGTSNRTITTGLRSGFVWIKNRSAAFPHILHDVVRGAGKTLYANLQAAEVNNGAYYVQQFNDTNFLLGLTDNTCNAAGSGYVGWVWDPGASTVTNTDGSITSQVRANPSAGFSIVTYTGNGTAGATIGHGLGASPALIIVKRRNSTSNWLVWNSVIAATNAANVLFLDATDAALAVSSNFNSTNPTSTVFTVGTNAATNASGSTYVAYCFAPVAGYSAFGSYTGNGSADGPFVYTGFRPRWVMIKSTGTGYWVIKDALRTAEYNPLNGNLYADLAQGEDTVASVNVDFLSNGFKIRGTYAGVNTSANTYIYAAFAENPFKTARAR